MEDHILVLSETVCHGDEFEHGMPRAAFTSRQQAEAWASSHLPWEGWPWSLSRLPLNPRGESGGGEPCLTESTIRAAEFFSGIFSKMGYRFEDHFHPTEGVETGRSHNVIYGELVPRLRNGERLVSLPADAKDVDWSFLGHDVHILRHAAFDDQYGALKLALWLFRHPDQWLEALPIEYIQEVE